MRNPYKTFSFQATFFTSFLIISASLIALLGATSYYITNQELVDETISTRELLLDEINKQIDLQLQAAEYDSLVIASNPTVIDYLEQSEDSFERIANNAGIVDLLSRYSYVKEGVHSVQLYSKNASVNSHIGANGVFAYGILENSPSYPMIRDADSAWLGARPLEVEGYLAGEKAVVSFMRKVMSFTGNELGVLVYNLKLSYVEHLMSSHSADGGRYILDSSLRLIAESNGPTDKYIPYSRMEQELPGIIGNVRDGRSFALADLGDKQLLVWNKQNRTQWMTMDIIPWDDLTKGSRRIQEIIWLTAVLCILLAVSMAYYLSKQFVRPIRRLVQAMSRMKTGSLDVRVANDYDNEFGRLNENFNDMTEYIGELIRQVNEQNRRKREAEIQVLQEQINPHFLYNTLDTMNWHAIESGADDISRMLSLLGRMLRIGLSSGAAFIPVEKEKEHLHCYVELQKIRYRNHIEFEFDIPSSMDDFFVPKLVIQPFVENSLIHGFRSGRQGHIRISGKEEGEKLIFTVEDNGYGMDAAAMSPARGHNGLRNVEERIELYFGPEYGVEIHSETGIGTQVKVSLPKLTEEPADRKEAI